MSYNLSRDYLRGEETMSQIKLAEWISPLEAALEMSIRGACYISPDDIKQARKRLPEGSYIPVSKRASVYKRDSIQKLKINKREQGEPTVETVVSWLWEFPGTIEVLEQEGFSIPHKEEAQTMLERQRSNKQQNPKPKKISI
jgi:hypothetical protein